MNLAEEDLESKKYVEKVDQVIVMNLLVFWCLAVGCWIFKRGTQGRELSYKY
jgi:hypothetical protein